jgi:hypothetical protein
MTKANGLSVNSAMQGDDPSLSADDQDNADGIWLSLDTLSPGGAASAVSAGAITGTFGATLDVSGGGLVITRAVLPTTAVIESVGATSLLQLNSNYELLASGAVSGPLVRYADAPIVVNGLGPWAPFAAEQQPYGYEVAFRAGSSNQYTLWYLDGLGNYVWGIGVVLGSSYAFQSLEPSFQQDLNGDGTTGVTITPVEAAGNTRLLHAADTYLMTPAGGSSGPQVRYGGAPVTVGSLGPWLAIAAESRSFGYQVVWQAGSTNQYIIWNLDGLGNYVSDSGILLGSSYALQSLEPSFQQDLNGDGTTGVQTTLIESSGTTSLLQGADTYLMYAVGGSSGPQIRYGGAAVVVGSLGPWVAIAAEQESYGYAAVWRAGSANQYTAWFLDGQGNYVWSTAVVSATSYTLETLEPSLHQDVNGDGLIGPTSTLIEAQGLTKFMQVADAYLMYPNNGPNGVVLEANGAQVVAGQFGTWNPLAAEQVAGGFEVLWKMTNADQYTVWLVDGAGNYLGNTAAMTHNSGLLTALEPTFRQDLDGSGAISSSTTIESFGVTALNQVGNYYVIGGGFPVALTLNGAAVFAGQFGSWAPIGAEVNGSGYLVAWKQGGADQYQVWSTDVAGASTGSIIGIVSGSSVALESLEPTFHQDLNGDGTIGVPATPFQIDINYTGDPAYLSYFQAAAQKWEQIIRADVPDANSPRYGYIDDLEISANVSFIDGPGQILGSTRVDEFRTASGIPDHATMTFDSSDFAALAANGTLSYVILHEMGHALGYGSMWSYDHLTSGFSYIGADAVAAYRQLSGIASATSVPLETGGGAGTVGVHWSEAVFGNELMTGYLNSPPDPLSILTIGAMQDLGYTVNYGAADPYNIPGHLVAGSDGASATLNVSVPAASQDATNGGQDASSAALAALYAGTGLTVDTDAPDVLTADEVAGVSSAGNVAALTSAMASSLVASPGPAAGNVAVASSDQSLLAKPAV